MKDTTQTTTPRRKVIITLNPMDHLLLCFWCVYRVMFWIKIVAGTTCSVHVRYDKLMALGSLARTRFEMRLDVEYFVFVKTNTFVYSGDNNFVLRDFASGFDRSVLWICIINKDVNFCIPDCPHRKYVIDKSIPYSPWLIYSATYIFYESNFT